jgi:nicotinic acid phosphoribosyltransferase
MPNLRSKLVTASAIGAAAIGGGAIASAATSSSASSSGSTVPLATQRPSAVNIPAHGTVAHEDAEKAVTGAAATKAQAAAVKAVRGGTAGAVTTDFTGNGYEVTVTKSGGSQVEIHLDSSFTVLQGSGAGGGPGRYAGYGG